jgi:RNA polymerase sigma factor (sigma-70 family)
METSLSPRPAAPADSARLLREALVADREQTLTQLYQRAFPSFRRYVLRGGGSAADAQDLFQDALVTLYEQAVAGRLTLTAAPATYLLAISRNLWRRELDRRRRQPGTPLGPDHAELAAEAPPAPEPAESVLTHVARLGERCRSILLSFYYFQQPLEQIARTHQYGSVRSATVQKFKCLERLRQAVRHLREELLPTQA